VGGLDDVVTLGDAVDRDGRGSEQAPLEEHLDLLGGRGVHHHAPEALAVGRGEVNVPEAVRFGGFLLEVQRRLGLLFVVRLGGGLLGGGRVAGLGRLVVRAGGSSGGRRLLLGRRLRRDQQGQPRSKQGKDDRARGARTV